MKKMTAKEMGKLDNEIIQLRNEVVKIIDLKQKNQKRGRRKSEHEILIEIKALETKLSSANKNRAG